MNTLCLYYPAGIEPAALRALGEACLRLSSQVALREGEAVFLEAGGSRLLYGAEGLRARLRALGRRFPGVLPPRLGEGADAGEALARARFGGADTALPLDALLCYASPFKADDAVEAALAPLLAAFEALGLKDLDGFRSFPAAGLGTRFGHDAATLRERVEGRFPMAWPRFEPAPVLEERQDLCAVEDQAAGPSAEALLFQLKGLCERVAARLRGRGLRAAGLRLSLAFERVRDRVDCAERVLEIPLALPVAAPRELARLLQQRLEAEVQSRPLPRPLAGLALRVTATAPGFSPQREAFDRREDESESLNGLLARLAQRLGEDRIFYAQLVERYLPEQAWKRERVPAAGGAPASASGTGADGDGLSRAAVPRPTRLLRKPLLLTRSGDWLLYWGGGKRGRRWRVVDWQGPERLGRPWWTVAEGDWDRDGLDRDYWRVRTAQGGDLWVFARAGAETEGGAYWLQGWWG